MTFHCRIFVPTGRAINPVTATNWEGTGVEPDIHVQQADALNEVYRLAPAAVLEKLGDGPSPRAKSQLEVARAVLAALGT